MINLRNISSFSHPTPCCFKKKKKKEKEKTHTRATGTREKSLRSSENRGSHCPQFWNVVIARAQNPLRSFDQGRSEEGFITTWRCVHGFFGPWKNTKSRRRRRRRRRRDTRVSGLRVDTGRASTTGTSSRRLAVHVVIIRSSNLQTYM